MQVLGCNMGLIWGGKSAIQPVFRSDLLTSLTPQKGQLASFSRSSTATVTDFEGQLLLVNPEEARFAGARRVENLATSTDSPVTQNINVKVGESYIVSCSTGDLSVAGAFAGSITGGGELTKAVATTSVLVITVSTAANLQIELAAPSQVQASAYVSNGVLASPYHGANVDGVKYFNTDRNGIAIPTTTLKGVMSESGITNYITNSDFHESQVAGGSIRPNPNEGGVFDSTLKTLDIQGKNTAWTISESAAQNFFGIGFKSTQGLLVSTTYKFSFYLKLQPSGRRYYSLYSIANESFIDLTGDGVEVTGTTTNPYTNLVIEYIAGTKNVDALFRISMDITTNVVGNVSYPALYPSSTNQPYGGNASSGYAGDPTMSTFVTCLQLEDTLHTTSYVPNDTTSTVSRASEVLAYNIPDFMRVPFDVFTVSIRVNTDISELNYSTANNPLFFVKENSSNMIKLHVDSTGVISVKVVGGGTSASFDGGTLLPHVEHKIVFKCNGTKLQLFINGIEKYPFLAMTALFTGSINIPSALDFRVGGNIGGIVQPDLNESRVRIYKKALSDAKCLELTL